MALKKEPFKAYRLDEEKAKDKSKVFTIRVNKEDQKLLRTLQELFDVASEGTMLKICAHQYYNVLMNNFSPRYIKYLFKRQRNRWSDYNDYGSSDISKDK